MGENYDIGNINFPPRDGTLDMTLEVQRLTPLRNPKIAIWVAGAAGGIFVAQARPVRRPGMMEVLVMENATGQETVAAVVSYNRLGMPQALEAGVELKDADGISIMEIPFRQIRRSEGDMAVQFF